MESIEFFQVFIIIIILIMTLFYIYFRSLTSSSSFSAAAADTDIPPLQEKYDVFISFRGKDTRDAFTSHLHAALLRNKIETYMDRRLEKGDEIGPALLKAIENSKIALVLLSKDYASSAWCLKELVHILGCKKSHGQIVIPIFYGIDPSDVRKQQGTYALKKRFKGSKDEVANWRAALEEAANISGFLDSSKTRTEADFVEKVVQDVLTKLNHESSNDLRGLVGIESKIEKIESLLCLDSPGVYCIGIWGMGGIGKTALAEAVFHRHSSKFEAYCFLANVREKSEQTGGLNQLLNELVREILKDKDINIGTLSIGPTSIRDRLMRTKALIVLDDVNASNQLEVLVGDHDRFRDGSRIIITARDKGVLEQKVDNDKIYKVEGLRLDEALQLFHSHAFRNKSPTRDYNKLSRKVIDYIKGIPLALKVVGSLFLGCKSKQEWEDQMNKLKRFPSEEVKKVLKVTYDGLEENEKEIFLDIACFHKGNNKNDVKVSLDSRGFCGEVGIKVLIDRSLISISKRKSIEMHDLVQEMGRAIVREQCIEEPGKRSRLFSAEDVYQVLTNNQIAATVPAISFNWSKIEKLNLNHANFEKMCQLKWLHVWHSKKSTLMVSLDLPNSLSYLHWHKYPLKSLPSKFSPVNLVELRLPSSQVGAQLWNEDQSLVNLKRIDLRYSQHLTQVPNLSWSLNIEHIDLKGCKSLVEIPSYFQHLGKLTYLGLRGCDNIKNLPKMPCNLEVLILYASGIEELPSSVWSHKKISHLDIRYCKHLTSLPSNTCKLKLSSLLSLHGCCSLRELWELPRNTTVLELPNISIRELRNTSIEFVVGITTITLFNCKDLVSLPMNIWKLKSLKSLDLSLCSKFQNFPEISEAMEHLKFLNLTGTAVKELPPSIGNLVALQNLDLHKCKNLEVVPNDLFCLTSLQELNLSLTKIKNIPASIKQAARLSRLCLVRCRSLESLPELPPSLKTIGRDQYRFSWYNVDIKVLQMNEKYLESLDLSGCSNFQHFPEILEAMEHLKFLNLSDTAVKEVPSSIGNLVALRNLDLIHCKNLVSLPTNIWKLKYLESLDLSGCSNFQHFPEVSEAMEHLKFLKLSYTEVKELPPSIGNLVALRELDLHKCKNLEVIPDDLFCITSLQKLNLSSTNIKSLPASIKQAARLSHLCLVGCKSLESLPELPHCCNVLKHLVARH